MSVKREVLCRSDEWWRENSKYYRCSASTVETLPNLQRPKKCPRSSNTRKGIGQRLKGTVTVFLLPFIDGSIDYFISSIDKKRTKPQDIQLQHYEEMLFHWARYQTCQDQK